ncbi:MAG: hypothetical protein M1828_004124 [Chrysothrix sp. TS-e1954]|nr:MAG: hypothetical protein M1828_004124 [Chrysothrix sp. TS-e1954]
MSTEAVSEELANLHKAVKDLQINPKNDCEAPKRPAQSCKAVFTPGAELREKTRALVVIKALEELDHGCTSDLRVQSDSSWNGTDWLEVDIIHFQATSAQMVIAVQHLEGVLRVVAGDTNWLLS